MEADSESFKRVKNAKAAAGEGQEAKRGNQEGYSNMGSSCKDASDFLEKKGLWENISRSARPNANGPTPDQLTIFYGDRVLVFDGIPAEKVCEIMLIAAAAAAADKSGGVKNIASGSPIGTPVLTGSPSMQSTANPPQAQLCSIYKSSLCKMQAELPIARKHSLQRFFEKRRDRLVSKNPYPTEKVAETKKSDLNDEAPADTGYFEKPLTYEEELQTKVAPKLASTSMKASCKS